MKHNFFLGRKFSGEQDLKERLFKWYTRANHRIHGTTRKVPQEVFEKEEKAKLIPLPQEEFKLSSVGIRKVYHDCHIYVDYNYYSVPFEYVGKEVEIELTKKLLKVAYQGKEITVHPRLSGRGSFLLNPVIILPTRGILIPNIRRSIRPRWLISEDIPSSYSSW